MKEEDVLAYEPKAATEFYEKWRAEFSKFSSTKPLNLCDQSVTAEQRTNIMAAMVTNHPQSYEFTKRWPVISTWMSQGLFNIKYFNEAVTTRQTLCVGIKDKKEVKIRMRKMKARYYAYSLHRSMPGFSLSACIKCMDEMVTELTGIEESIEFQTQAQKIAESEQMEQQLKSNIELTAKSLLSGDITQEQRQTVAAAIASAITASAQSKVRDLPMTEEMKEALNPKDDSLADAAVAASKELSRIRAIESIEEKSME